MVKTRFIGDVHGDWMSYLNLLFPPKNPCTRSVQVGDFGLGFGERKEHVDYITEHMNAQHHDHRFIRGNHDDLRECRKHPQWITDGLRENGVMYIGGAHSIDRAYRTEGVNWWNDEELSYDELNHMVSLYEEYKPKVMVTHDCPDTVARQLFEFYNDPKCESRTRNAFDSMFFETNHRPKLWIFGHWHCTKVRTILDTVFCCLNINETIDIDIENDI